MLMVSADSRNCSGRIWVRRLPRVKAQKRRGFIPFAPVRLFRATDVRSIDQISLADLRNSISSCKQFFYYHFAYIVLFSHSSRITLRIFCVFQLAI